jgi:hypothetical protein
MPISRKDLYQRRCNGSTMGISMNRLTKITIALVIIWLVIAVSNMALQDEIDESNIYKENVCSGHWPDYKNINPQCED